MCNTPIFYTRKNTHTHAHKKPCLRNHVSDDYRATVMKNLQIFNLLPVLVLASLVLNISGSVPLRPVLTGPDMAYLGTRVDFQCVAPESPPPVTYELMKDSDILIDIGSDQHGDQPVTFSFKVTAAAEGSFHCKATAGGKTGVSNSIRLQAVTPVSGTRVTSDPSPPILYEGSRLVLSCEVTRGSHLSYTWYFNKAEVTSSVLSSHQLIENRLVVEKVATKHAGNYSCMAGTTEIENKRYSSSGEIQVTVKAYFSTPSISFTISKEGNNYSGNVACWSSRGSPPVTFYLLLDDREVGSVMATESPLAWFPVALLPGRDMGVVQCRLQSEKQQLMSEHLTLEVVPVGGHIEVEVEYLYRDDSKVAAARLQCQLSRGTFPYFTWFFNDSHLPTEAQPDLHIQSLISHYALADRRQTLIITKLGPEESGYYSCRARDSYDDSAPWLESAAVLVQVTELSITTIEVISIAFCCFMFLALVLGVVFVLKMFDHNQANVHMNATTNLDARPLPATTSQMEDKQMDTPTPDTDVHNQTMEITV